MPGRRDPFSGGPHRPRPEPDAPRPRPPAPGRAAAAVCLAMVALATLTAPACASRGRGGDRLSPRIARTVEVANDNRADVVVYAVVGGQRYRLGMVTAKLSATLEIPETVNLVAQDVSFFLDAVGGNEAYLTRLVNPAGGSVIFLVVAPNLGASRVTVR